MAMNSAESEDSYIHEKENPVLFHREAFKDEENAIGDIPSEDGANIAATASDVDDKDIDGGYGWVVIFAAFLLTFSTWGMNSAYGVYFTYYINTNHFEGAKVFDYAAIGGISFGVGIAFSPIINYIQGRIGTRPTILLGNCFQFSASMLASFAVNKWQLYLTQGLLQSFGLAFISLPSFTLAPQWFVKKRVLANSLTAAGSGVGGIAFNLGLQKIIEVESVNWALRAQAIISAGLVTIAILLIKTRHKQHKVEFTLIDMDVAKCAGFWMLSFYLVCCMFGYVVVMYSLNDFTVSLGYSAHQGSIVSAMLPVGFCIGRPLAGYASDYWGPFTVTSASYYLSAIFTLAMWVPAKNYATVIALALLEGLVIGTVFSTSSPLTARLVGMAKLNVAFCMSWVFCGVAALFSQMIGSSLTSGTGPDQYKNTAIFSGVALFATATTVLAMRGYVLARDRIIEKQHEESMSRGEEIIVTTNDLHIFVPPMAIVKNCLTWPQKRA